IGRLFIGHGRQKLKGWFGGSGPAGTNEMTKSIGLNAPRRYTLAARYTVTACGSLLALRLATPLPSAGLIGMMLTAIRTVHLPNGVWNHDGGWEYNAVLIAALALLAEEGPGKVSLDHALGKDTQRKRRGLAALALGA